MKKTLFFTAALIFCATLCAQVPEGISHQAEPTLGQNSSIKHNPDPGNFNQQPLKQLLNADGTLNLTGSFSGSLDPAGFQMLIAPDGEPMFIRNPQDDFDQPAYLQNQTRAEGDENWHQFSWPSDGVDNWVHALAVSSSDVYVGGRFTSADGAIISRIAKWNGNFWSALGSGVNGTIYAIAVSGSDVYVGGDFTEAGGISASRIAKWDGTSWSALGSGVDNPVVAITISGSDVFVGGSFTHAGGISASSIAKWDSYAETWSSLGSGVNGPVYALAISGNDVYVGGNFTEAGDLNTNSIAKWNGSVWSALGSGVTVIVKAIAVSGNDVYVGGVINEAGGVSVKNIAKWDGTNWSALGSGLNTIVEAIAVSGGDVYVVGHFNQAGGQNANYIAKWNGTSWSALGNGVNGILHAIAFLGNEVYAGGYFSEAGDQNANNIAKWDGTSWSPLGSGFNGFVRSVAVSGNDLYVGGDFTTAGGLSASRIAKWDGTSWSALGNGVSGPVHAIAISGNDVYVGGNFSKGFILKDYDDVGLGATNEGKENLYSFAFQKKYIPVFISYNIAKWDIDTETWSPLCIGVNNEVRAIAVSGSDVYVGGVFTEAGGVNANHIAKWDGSSWSPMGRDVNGDLGEVYAITVSGNEVYVGGNIIGGIKKWDGSSWSVLGSGVNGTIGHVYAITLSGNDLYVGGDFVQAGDLGVNGIAKWNGTSWSNLDGGLGGYTNKAYAIAVNADHVYVGGSFTQAGGDNANNIARWDGSSWSPMGSGVNGSVRAIAVLGSEVYLGGYFTEAGGLASGYFANWNESDHEEEPSWISCPDMPTVTDIDGNVYNTVLIGDQCWMRENLKTTTYRNNTLIETPENCYDWWDTDYAAYTWLDCDESWSDIYGALYNWYAVNDINGLCPQGWKVPSYNDWLELHSFIHSNGFDEAVGDKLKSCRQENSPLGGYCTTTEHPRWQASDTSWGNDHFGFSGHPGGFFGGLAGQSANWWLSDEHESGGAYRFSLEYWSSEMHFGIHGKEMGFSVRCIIDSDPSTIFNLNLDASPTVAGTVTGAGGYEAGSQVSISASANPGWEFVSWTGDTGYVDDPASATTTVTMPAFDITLTANFAVLHQITLNLDMSPAPDFNPGVDAVYVTGSFWGDWVVPGDDPDNQLMAPEGDTMIWTKTLYLPPGDYQYKYFMNEGWDGGEWGGEPNREITVAGDMVVNDTWGYLEVPEVIDIETLAELRNKPPGETIYRYTGEAVIVAMDDFQNRKYIQDATAAIFINDQLGNITTGYELYDLITQVTGVIEIINNMVRFIPIENAPEALGNTPIEPYLLALDEVTPNDQAKLIKFNDVAFEDVEVGEVFTGGQNYTLTDGVNTFVLRTMFWDEDYIGMEIPHGTLSITGVVTQFHDLLQITPRFAADIEDHYAEEEWPPCPDMPTVTDIEGNVYNTVLIGGQCWIRENLRATKYHNGNDITTGLSNEEWGSTTEGAYAIYPHSFIGGLNSDEEVLGAYGALYNWYAVNTGNLCPEGWSVPSDVDWTALVNYVVAQGYPNEWNLPNGAGNALKSCRQVGHPDGGDCDTSEHPRWNSDDTHNGFDAIGFLALPGGIRFTTNYFGIGYLGLWWSSSENSSSTDAWRRSVGSDIGNVLRNSSDKSNGFSVRCFRDSTEEPTLFNLNLELSPENAGNVQGAGQFQEGEEVHISATANEGWGFVNWTGDTGHIDDTASATTTVTMPAFDITLTANFAVLHELTLNVDMSPAPDFDPETDLVYVTGTFVDFWPIPGSDPDNQLMTREGETMIWTKTIQLAPGDYQYKYFMNEGWDGGEWGGEPNRTITVTDDIVVNDTWGYIEPIEGGNIMVVHDATASVNGIVTIELEIINEDEFVGFNTDIALPSGFTYVPGSAQLHRDDGHFFNFDILPGNVARMISAAIPTAPFPGNDGVIVSFDLQTPGEEGTFHFCVSDAVIADENGVNIMTGDICGVITLVETSTVIFLVTNYLGFEIDHAVITLGGVENPAGDYVFENVEQGTHPYIIEKDCYLVAEDFVVVSGLDVYVEELLGNILGDANDDGVVNVSDIVIIVNYFMGQSPDPFCFINADVNGDGVINVSDVVGATNIYMGGKISPHEGLKSQKADVYLYPEGIYIESDGTLTAMQFELTGKNLEALSMVLTLPTHQIMHSINDNKLTAMVFSLSNAPIPGGKVRIIDLEPVGNHLEWGEVLVANLNAELVDVEMHTDEATDVTDIQGVDNIRVYPNPAKDVLWIELENNSGEAVEVSLKNIHGQHIKNEVISGQGHVKTGMGISELSAGAYMLRIKTSRSGITKRVIVGQ